MGDGEKRIEARCFALPPDGSRPRSRHRALARRIGREPDQRLGASRTYPSWRNAGGHERRKTRPGGRGGWEEGRSPAIPRGRAAGLGIYVAARDAARAIGAVRG